ncbi:MAG: hypothetical protein AB8I08_38360 [Sandaracinaceae bacterium]
MKNATLSVRLILMLGAALWVGSASVATAQTDDTTTPDASGAEDETDSTDADAPDGETPDAAAADEAAADEGATDEGATDEWIDDGHDEVEPPSGLPTDPAPVEAQSTPTEEPADSTEEAAATDELASPDGEEAAEAPAEEEAAPAAPEPLPWRNSFFTWTNQVSFNTFFRDAQLSYNPVYQQNFTLTPRWYIAPTTFLWANQGLGIEVTDTDGLPLNRDPQLTDTLLDLRHIIPWEGFVFIVAGRLGFPTSKISQASQRYLQTGATLTVVRPISEAGLTLAGVFSYRRWWAGSNVTQVGEPQPDICPAAPAPTAGTGDAAPIAPSASATCDQLGTATAASDVLLYGLNVVFTPPGFAELNVSLSAFFFTTHGYGLAPAEVAVDTREEALILEDGSPSHWRNFTFFSLSVGYQFAPWLNASIGIQNSGFLASAYNPDGSIRNPLFTPDTQVFLSATFQLDEVYNGIAGGEEDNLTPEERQRRRQGLAQGPAAGGTF